MHTFLQGLVKTLWYHNWVRGGHAKAAKYKIPPILLKVTDHVNTKIASNFLKLATVIKIYTHRQISETELDWADRLYKDFFEEYVEIYGEINVTPTFHWVTHMAAQVRCFGPAQGFWTFLFEHLNKVLKTIRTNRRKRGGVELTFAQEFKRELSISRLTTVLLTQWQDFLARLIAQEMDKQLRDLAHKGTLTSMAAEADEDADLHNRARWQPIGKPERVYLDNGTQQHLLAWYCEKMPNLPL
ncbi:hypothetical protein DACRYDRAFT_15351 [Dacryopinax primogenitus]|uniref:Uncharacterized protein n=1 Tax=Dacryopinax primogenitus (strain DJM 731) TaxID=1858805 RepID=M5G9Z8_DACPD|nr:uncharacterized protein DACRYDRAFT_15351 [Dacryopinax primogenitus]EJU02722.1 hypothetical protein DACRYDRAFT_15351 [Dacryopinax primogenitus]